MEQAAQTSRASRQDRFLGLLDEHRKILFKVAGSYARGALDRQDLVQEMVVQLWRSFDRYDPALRFSTWMYRIALNVAISWLRSETPRRRRSVAYDAGMHEPAAEDTADEDEGRRILRGFVASQEALDRAVLLLYLEETPYSEMSEVLGITVTNLTTKINRLKDRLRTYAEKHHGTR